VIKATTFKARRRYLFRVTGYKCSKLNDEGLSGCIRNAMKTRDLPEETSTKVQMNNFIAFKYYGHMCDHAELYDIENTFMFNRRRAFLRIGSGR
jgi:hypothetical protein